MKIQNVDRSGPDLRVEFEDGDDYGVILLQPVTSHGMRVGEMLDHIVGVLDAAAEVGR